MAKPYVDYAMSVIQDNNAQTMTSLQIAEITGKRHSDVMRAIRTMEDAWAKINGRNFALVEYTDAKGEKRPCYALNKTECLYIATKFNDEARAKLVLRWQALEEAEKARQPKVPTSFKEALLLAAAQQEQIERQQLLIEQKTEQLDESKEWFTIKRWAKIHKKNWRVYNWRKLKALSFELGYAPKKILTLTMKWSTSITEIPLKPHMGNRGWAPITNRRLCVIFYNAISCFAVYVCPINCRTPLALCQTILSYR